MKPLSGNHEAILMHMCLSQHFTATQLFASTPAITHLCTHGHSPSFHPLPRLKLKFLKLHTRTDTHIYTHTNIHTYYITPCCCLSNPCFEYACPLGGCGAASRSAGIVWRQRAANLSDQHFLHRGASVAGLNPTDEICCIQLMFSFLTKCRYQHAINKDGFLHNGLHSLAWLE
jgi:hypothetical protein